MEGERYNDCTCSLATTYDKLYIFLVKTPSEDTYYSVLGKKKPIYQYHKINGRSTGKSSARRQETPEMTCEKYGTELPGCHWSCEFKNMVPCCRCFWTFGKQVTAVRGDFNFCELLCQQKQPKLRGTWPLPHFCHLNLTVTASN